MKQNDHITELSRLVADDAKTIFGDNLVSVILYGSAVTAEYVPRKSDLNFLIVLTEEGIRQLNLVHGIAGGWRKKRVMTPLFLTQEYIDSSLDTFPLEFLNIKRNYSVISGEDVLKGLLFEKEFVRMQCERELKGKLLLLRKGYVETGGKPQALKQLVSDSISTFVFIFKGLLYLLDREVPLTKQETISIIAGELNLDKDLFLSLLQIRKGTIKPSKSEFQELFQKYLNEIRSLAMNVDTWQKK